MSLLIAACILCWTAMTPWRSISCCRTSPRPHGIRPAHRRCTRNRRRIISQVNHCFGSSRPAGLRDCCAGMELSGPLVGDHPLLAAADRFASVPLPQSFTVCQIRAPQRCFSREQILQHSHRWRQRFYIPRVAGIGVPSGVTTAQGAFSTCRG